MPSSPRALRAVAECLESRLLLASAPAPLGPEFLVPSNSSGNEDIDPDSEVVASDGAGNFVVVWGEDDLTIWFRRFGRTGTPLAAATRVAAAPSLHSELPTVAMNGRGDFVVAWTQGDAASGAESIHAQRFSAAGAALGSAITVAPDVNINPVCPRAAIDDRGDFVVTWSDDRAGAQTNVFARRYDAAAQTQGPVFTVGQTAGGIPSNPDVAMDAAGEFVVAWNAHFPLPGGPYAQRFDAAGRPVGNQFALSSTPNVSNVPRVAMDAAGNFAAVFLDVHQGRADVTVRLFDRDGTPVRTAYASLNDDARWPQIDMAAGGRFVVVWERNNAPTDNLFGRAFDAEGVPQGQEFQLNGTTADELNIGGGVAIADDGGIAAAWQTIPEGFGESDVYARVFAPAAPDPAARVVGRHVFYNRSSFDGSDGAPNAADDGAIATDKNALLANSDRLPAFDNVTSYDKGLNGVMIDVENLPVVDAMLDASDFDFAPAGHAPISVTVRPGAGEGGSDRVTLIWRDYNPNDASAVAQAVGNGWLTVTMKANYHTGLAAPDVFSFGNLIAETGDGGAAAGWRVSALDLSAVKRALNTTSAITAATDFNRDGRTNALDLAIVKPNLNHTLALMPTAVAAPSLAPRPTRWISGLLD